jgi:hypothetical protein
MKFITQLKNFMPDKMSYLWSKQPKVLLGRWTIDYCENKINKKVDLSNEDHCGTCNNYINYNYINNNINIKKLIFFETM